MAPKVRRSYFGFSLRMLLLVVTAVAIWLGMETNRLRKQGAAIQAIDELGGTNGAYVEGPAWLRSFWGDDRCFRNASRVTFVEANERTLPPSLPFTDEELGRMIDHVNAFSRFRHLDIPSTLVTDDGLKHLHRLHNLKHLNISDTAITDRGLVHLEGIGSLHGLELVGTKVTAAGIAGLQEALPGCKIRIDDQVPPGFFDD